MTQVKPKSRPPVVVVLGHVDHGKTTLLDYIRKTNVAGGEEGGITQSIGAWEAKLSVKGYATDKITFIDTPGHEAFSVLRSRGADVADIAVLIVDANDSVMPQTKESIFHIKNAKIPFIIAINKIDLKDVKLEKVKKDISKEGVELEGFGGKVPVAAISAKQGTGVNELLELILLVAAECELKASENNPLKAYIIESRTEKSGIMISAVVKDGSLKVGDTVYAGSIKAKIKALIDYQGNSIKKATPSMPFGLLGFKELVPAGVALTVKRETPKEIKKEEKSEINAKELFKTEEDKKLRVILKTNSQGSLDTLESLFAKNKDIEIILSGLGEITKSDIFLAKVSKAIIIGFSLSAHDNISNLAKEEKVLIKTYSIIYQLIEELEEVMKLVSKKKDKEPTIKGEAKILAKFIVEGENISGIKITKGKISLNDRIDLFRKKKRLRKAKIVSMKTRAHDVKELKKDEEGGVLFHPQLDINIGDVLKSYSI